MHQRLWLWGRGGHRQQGMLEVHVKGGIGGQVVGVLIAGHSVPSNGVASVVRAGAALLFCSFCSDSCDEAGLLDLCKLL